MMDFLLLLLLGFGSNLLSAFTGAFSRRWGNRAGRVLTFLLRNISGIPVWAAGFSLAVGTPSPVLMDTGPGTMMFGWVLILAGAAIILAALREIRIRALAPAMGDALAGGGIYTRIRHPIHSGTFLEFAGVFLLRPTLSVALACGLGTGWLVTQTLLEERDLLQRIPGYREYMASVPRFLPALRPPPPPEKRF